MPDSEINKFKTLNYFYLIIFSSSKVEFLKYGLSLGSKSLATGYHGFILINLPGDGKPLHLVFDPSHFVYNKLFGNEICKILGYDDLVSRMYTCSTEKCKK